MIMYSSSSYCKGDTFRDQYNNVYYHVMANYGGDKHDVEAEGTRKMVKRMLKIGYADIQDENEEWRFPDQAMEREKRMKLYERLFTQTMSDKDKYYVG